MNEFNFDLPELPEGQKFRRFDHPRRYTLAEPLPSDPTGWKKAWFTLRTVAFFLSLSLIVLATSPLAILGSMHPKENNIFMRVGAFVISRAGRFLMHYVAGLKVKVEGKENILKNRPAIYAAQHSGYGDALPMFAKIPNASFVSGDHMKIAFPIPPAVFNFLKNPLAKEPARISVKKVEFTKKDGTPVTKYSLVLDWINLAMEKYGGIVLSNCGGEEARRILRQNAAEAMARKQSILIYPAGKLERAGEYVLYGKGSVDMQTASGTDEDGNGIPDRPAMPLVGIASDLALFFNEDAPPMQMPWNKKFRPIIPGTATIRFLPAIEFDATRCPSVTNKMLQRQVLKNTKELMERTIQKQFKQAKRITEAKSKAQAATRPDVKAKAASVIHSRL